MRLFADEDVDVLLARLLANYDYDVLTVRDAGRLGATDEEQLAFSTEQDRVLLTHNARDFRALAVAWFLEGRVHAGIVMMRRDKDVYALARRVHWYLQSHDQPALRGQVLEC